MSYWLITMSEATKLSQAEAHALKQFLIGLQADGPTPVPPPLRYVVRAETDCGPLYLHSLQGSMTEWTSEQRYAQRYGLEEARENRDNAFCPDARSFHVRKLRPSPGYHVNRCDGLVFVWGDADCTYDSAYTRVFDKRRIFKTKKAAWNWIDERVAGGRTFDATDFQIVPEAPVVPESGASAK